MLLQHHPKLNFYIHNGALLNKTKSFTLYIFRIFDTEKGRFLSLFTKLYELIENMTSTSLLSNLSITTAIHLT